MLSLSYDNDVLFSGSGEQWLAVQGCGLLNKIEPYVWLK